MMMNDLIERLRKRTLVHHGGESKYGWNLTEGDSELHIEAATEIEALRGQHTVLVRLLVEADKVLGTIDGESQEEWDMLLQLRRCITAATMPHRPEDANLLSIRERLGC